MDGAVGVSAVLTPGSLWTPPSPAEKLRDLRDWLTKRREIEVVSAAALDQKLGHNVNASTSTTTVALSTSTTTAAGVLIVLFVVWRSGGTFSVSGGGLTWAYSSIATQGSAPTMSVGVAYAYSSGSVTTGTTLTVTFNTTITRPMVSGASFTGADTTPTKDQDSGNATFNNTTWVTPTITTAFAGEIIIAGSGSVGTGVAATDTPSAGYTNLAGAAGDSWSAATDQLGTMNYKIGAGAGSETGGGTWSSAQTGAGQAQVIVTFKAAGAGGGGFFRRNIFVSREAQNRASRW